MQHRAALILPPLLALALLADGAPRRAGPHYGYRMPDRDRKILVPRGLGLENVALNKPVTSSEEEIIIGTLGQVTDGDKECQEESYVALGPGPQWVQIDLGEDAKDADHYISSEERLRVYMAIQ